MFPLSSAWTFEAGLFSKTGITELWDTSVPIISGTYIDAVYSSLPHHGLRETILVTGRCQGSQAKTSRIQGRVYAITPQAKLADKSVIHSMFLLFRLWARVLFDYSASHSFVASSCVKDLGLKVETLENPLYVNSPLRTRVSFDMIC